jgi:hypothetical protein
MKPKSDVQACAYALKNQTIDSAVRFLSAYEAVAWRDIPVAHIEAGTEVFALPDVLDLIVRDERIYARARNVPWDLELAERTIPVLVQRQPSRIVVSTLRHELPNSSVGVPFRLDVTDKPERVFTDI